MATSADLHSILTQLSKTDADTLTSTDSFSQETGALAQKAVEMAREQGVELDPAAISAQIDTLRLLTALMKREAALAKVLLHPDDAKAKARRIQAMASSHGMTMDLQALEELLQHPESVETGAELTDTELAGVAGGSSFLGDMFGNLMQFLTRLGEVSSSRGRQI